MAEKASPASAEDVSPITVSTARKTSSRMAADAQRGSEAGDGPSFRGVEGNAGQARQRLPTRRADRSHTPDPSGIVRHDQDTSAQASPASRGGCPLLARRACRQPLRGSYARRATDLCATTRAVAEFHSQRLTCHPFTRQGSTATPSQSSGRPLQVLMPRVRPKGLEAPATDARRAVLWLRHVEFNGEPRRNESHFWRG